LCKINDAYNDAEIEENNFCVSAKYYLNRLTVEKVITKIKGWTF